MRFSNRKILASRSAKLLDLKIFSLKRLALNFKALTPSENPALEL